MLFDTVFEEEVVTGGVVTYILSDVEVLYGVNGSDSCVRFVDCVAAYITVRHISVHMEMNGVTSDDCWLTDSGELGILDSGSCSSFGLSVHHHVGSVFFLG